MWDKPIVKILLLVAAIVLPIYFAFYNCSQSKNDFLFICLSKVVIATWVYPLIIAFFFRQYLTNTLKILIIFIVGILLVNMMEQLFIWVSVNHFYLIEDFVKKFNISDTSFLQIAYLLVSVPVLGILYTKLLPPRFTVLITAIWVSLAVAMVFNYLFIEGYQILGFFNRTADGLFCICLSAFHLWYLFKTTFNFPLSKNPYFWISFGILFNYLVALILIIAGDFIRDMDYELFIRLSIAKNGVDILTNIFFAIGFWQANYAAYLPLPSDNKIK